MTQDDWNFVIVVSLFSIVPICLVFLLYLLSDYLSYRGGQGSDDPRGYNEWTIL